MEVLKGSKIERTNSQGFVYTYSEGKMSFPDSLINPLEQSSQERVDLRLLASNM